MGTIVVIPIGALIFGSFWSTYPGTPGNFTLQNYFDAFSDPRSLRLLILSINSIDKIE